jgi:hypothetical protein
LLLSFNCQFIDCRSKKDERLSDGLLKKQAPAGEACFMDLQLYDVLSFRAFIAFNHVEAHIIALGQALEATAINGGVVGENIDAIFLCDETETLGLIEPLYSSVCHTDIPPYKDLKSKEGES